MPKFHVSVKNRTATSGSDAAARASEVGCYRSAVSLSPVSLRIMLLYANLYANYNNACRELLKTISLIPNCKAGIRVSLGQHYTRRNISLL